MGLILRKLSQQSKLSKAFCREIDKLVTQKIFNFRFSVCVIKVIRIKIKNSFREILHTVFRLNF